MCCPHLQGDSYQLSNHSISLLHVRGRTPPLRRARLPASWPGFADPGVHPRRGLKAIEALTLSSETPFPPSYSLQGFDMYMCAELQ